MPSSSSTLRWLVALAILAYIVLAVTPEEEYARKEQLKERFQIAREKVREQKGVSIEIESVTECDQKDVLPDGCRHPVPVYPLRPRYVEWDFEKRYTLTWRNVDDDFPQQFQWHTYYCGSVNRTLEKGQRQFDFTFKELAAEFSKSECNYTMEEVRKLANCARNSISVTQPEKPNVMLSGIGFFPILDIETNMIVRHLRYAVSWRRFGTESLEKKVAQQVTGARWLHSCSQIALGSSLLAIVSFWLGTKSAKREQGRVQLK